MLLIILNSEKNSPFSCYGTIRLRAGNEIPACGGVCPLPGRWNPYSKGDRYERKIKVKGQLRFMQWPLYFIYEMLS